MLLCIIEDENQIEKSKFIRGNTMKKFGKVLFKILKWIFIILVCIIVLFLIVRFIGQRIYSSTPEGGINEEMYVDINGTKQWISIYGQDKDNPILLYLQYFKNSSAPGLKGTSYVYFSIAIRFHISFSSSTLSER